MFVRLSNLCIFEGVSFTVLPLSEIRRATGRSYSHKERKWIFFSSHSRVETNPVGLDVQFVNHVLQEKKTVSWRSNMLIVRKSGRVARNVRLDASLSSFRFFHHVVALRLPVSLMGLGTSSSALYRSQQRGFALSKVWFYSAWLLTCSNNFFLHLG